MEWLILDEADKLFEEGKDGFREQVRYLYLAVLFAQEIVSLILVKSLY